MRTSKKSHIKVEYNSQVDKLTTTMPKPAHSWVEIWSHREFAQGERKKQLSHRGRINTGQCLPVCCSPVSTNNKLEFSMSLQIPASAQVPHLLAIQACDKRFYLFLRVSELVIHLSPNLTNQSSYHCKLALFSS